MWHGAIKNITLCAIQRAKIIHAFHRVSYHVFEKQICCEYNSAFELGYASYSLMNERKAYCTQYIFCQENSINPVASLLINYSLNEYIFWNTLPLSYLIRFTYECDFDIIIIRYFMYWLLSRYQCFA